MSIEDLVQPGSALRAVHQPIVEIATGRIVAYEALLRGPVGPLESPVALFAAAARADLVAELDWAGRAAASVGVVGPGGEPVHLFINVEPAALGSPPPPWLAEQFERRRDSPLVCIELTERALIADPAEVVRAADRIRSWGWRLALDDVGADPASLALLPLLRPDVIKLDMRLVQSRTDDEVARTVAAVGSEAQHSGAVVLAEGIESADHEQRALAWGADLGQGYRYGPPERQERFEPGDEWALPRLSPSPGARTTPVGCLEGRVNWRIGPKRMLLPIARLLEHYALDDRDRCVILASFQRDEFFTLETARRYRDLGRRAAFAAVMGAGLSDHPAGLRGARLEPDDPLVEEWDLVVLGPHFAGALIARDLGDTGPDRERRFRYTVTYDRDQVADAARQMLLRIQPRQT